MGFLKVAGGVLTYNQYKEQSKIKQYKMHGLNQFVHLYNEHKDKFIPLSDLKWGEEMEYQVYVLDPKNQQIKLDNRGPEMIKIFNEAEFSEETEVYLMPEFGGWMIEAVPAKPYNSIQNAEDLLSCEEKLHKRRETLQKFLRKNDPNLIIVSLPNAPGLGTPDHIVYQNQELEEQIQQKGLSVALEEHNKSSRSIFVIDETINPHPRFAGLVKSIRERRGEKVNIQVPIYQDLKTNLTEATVEEPYPGQIYMDAMHFGMGQCCLQITYECSTLNHARYLHDMLLPFTGIMAALSASGPIQKGKLSANDLRWTVIEQSVDCRTVEERDPDNEKFIPKSRYSGMNHYLSNNTYVKDEHFDGISIKYDPEFLQFLKERCQIDNRLGQHIARLFTRDPVPAYEGEFVEDQIDDSDLVAHFENLQSTNWNSMRFKPPPSKDSKIGWRVEFRTMDIQLTDFENTCLIVLLGLITNVCNHYDVDFILPITMVDINLQRAHKQDALLKEKFWFNVNCIKSSRNNETGRFTDAIQQLQESDFLKSEIPLEQRSDSKYEELYIHEILGGKPSSGFLGIYSLLKDFMQLKNFKEEHISQIDQVLEFLLARAQGTVPTGAKFIREFVLQHPLYQQDSIVPQRIICDLMVQLLKLNVDDFTCLCEKKTDSNSCDENCEEYNQYFEEMAKQIEIEVNSVANEGSFEDEQIDSQFINLKNSSSNILGLISSSIYSQGSDSRIKESPARFQDKGPEDQDLEEAKDQSHLFVGGIDQGLLKDISPSDLNLNKQNSSKVSQVSIRQIVKERIQGIKLSSDEARSKLLGQQWFQGRTGFTNKISKFQISSKDEKSPIQNNPEDQLEELKTS